MHNVYTVLLDGQFSGIVCARERLGGSVSPPRHTNVEQQR